MRREEDRQQQLGHVALEVAELVDEAQLLRLDLLDKQGSLDLLVDVSPEERKLLLGWDMLLVAAEQGKWNL